MKKILVILDPAHGSDVAGKRSPDGKHEEWKWSRERLKELAPKLIELGYTVVWTNTTDNEIGLTVRKNTASQFAKQHPDLVSLLFSLHNDASGITPEWRSASGVSVWTSIGKTTSDIFADIFLQCFIDLIPDIRHRIYSPKPLERDFENNFTVLMGAYSAVLLECLFQDNKEDVAKLQNPEFNKSVVRCVIEAFDRCNEYVTQKLTK